MRGDMVIEAQTKSSHNKQILLLSTSVLLSFSLLLHSHPHVFKMSKIYVSYNQIHTMIKQTVESSKLNEVFQPDIMGNQQRDRRR